jgi:hypothetical protein
MFLNDTKNSERKPKGSSFAANAPSRALKTELNSVDTDSCVRGRDHVSWLQSEDSDYLRIEQDLELGLHFHLEAGGGWGTGIDFDCGHNFLLVLSARKQIKDIVMCINHKVFCSVDFQDPH